MAITIWQSCGFSALLSIATLTSLISILLSLTIGRRSLFELFAAVHADIAAYLLWSERISKCVAHWFYWQILHPIFWQLAHYWDVINRRRSLIVIVMTVTVALVALVTFLLCPTFASTARIWIKNDGGGLVMMPPNTSLEPTGVDAGSSASRSTSSVAGGSVLGR